MTTLQITVAQQWIQAQEQYLSEVAQVREYLEATYVGKKFRVTYGAPYNETFLVTFTDVDVRCFHDNIAPTFIVNGLKHRKDGSVGLNRDFFMAKITADSVGPSLDDRKTYTPEA